MTLVAGVDSSTQSCKVVIRDLETGAVVRSGDLLIDGSIVNKLQRLDVELTTG